MITYEIGFIIAPDAPETEVNRITEQIQALLAKEKAEDVKVDLWGVKPMTYPIKNYKEGYYVFMHCRALGETINGVEKRLRQFEKVIRFITLKLDERLRKANRLTRKWSRIEKLRKRNEVETEAAEAEAAPATKEAENEN